MFVDIFVFISIKSLDAEHQSRISGPFSKQ